MDQFLPKAFAAALPLADEARLSLLADLHILDTPSERAFDTIVRMAKAAANAEIALISLVDRDRQWFKAKCGLDANETPIEQAFCAHAIQCDGAMIVPDARADSRFSDNPLVTGPPFIRSYAGIPLQIRSLDASRTVTAIGTLCVIGSEARDISANELEALEELGHLTEALIEARAMTANAIHLAEQRSSYLAQLDRKNRQFRQAERMANIGSWRLTLADNRTEWSDQVYTIHGLPIGQGYDLHEALSFYPPDTRVTVSQVLANTIATGQPFDIETDFMTAQGAARRVRAMGEVELLDGKPIAVVGAFQDVTTQYANEQRLRRSAHSDDLTGLANRARLNEVLDARIADPRKAGDPLAVLLIDLDGFKNVNDLCGHRAGDEMLQIIAYRLRAPYLNGSFAARLGGDEFVVIIDQHSLCANLEPLVQRLLGDLQQSIERPNDWVHVSATIGAANWNAGMRGRSDLIHYADLALYEAKRHRRGCAKIAGRDGFLSVNNARLNS